MTDQELDQYSTCLQQHNYSLLRASRLTNARDNTCDRLAEVESELRKYKAERVDLVKDLVRIAVELDHVHLEIQEQTHVEKQLRRSATT